MKKAKENYYSKVERKYWHCRAWRGRTLIKKSLLLMRGPSPIVQSPIAMAGKEKKYIAVKKRVSKKRKTGEKEELINKPKRIKKIKKKYISK